MKVNRHAKIVELINKYQIETQDELAEYLNETTLKLYQTQLNPHFIMLRLSASTRLQGGFILLAEGILLGKWFGCILQPNGFIGAARLQIMSCCCINFAFGTKL